MAPFSVRIRRPTKRASKVSSVPPPKVSTEDQISSVSIYRSSSTVRLSRSIGPQNERNEGAGLRCWRVDRFGGILPSQADAVDFLQCQSRHLYDMRPLQRRL